MVCKMKIHNLLKMIKKTDSKLQKKRKKADASSDSSSATQSDINGDKSVTESESMTNVISYAMSSLNGYSENPYATPQKSGHAHGLVHATSTPIYPVQYPPPPLPISCLHQVPPANYQIPPTEAQSSDLGKILNEVLNRLNGLDQKLVRLDDIDKKLLKLDTMATNLDKLSDKVKGINNEVFLIRENKS